MYYYILEEYKVSNEMLTEDIYVRDLFAQLCAPHHVSCFRCQTSRYAQLCSNDWVEEDNTGGLTTDLSSCRFNLGTSSLRLK